VLSVALVLFIFFLFVYFRYRFGLIGVLLFSLPFDRIYLDVGFSLRIVLIASLFAVFELIRNHKFILSLKGYKGYMAIYSLLFIVMLSAFVNNPLPGQIGPILSLVVASILIIYMRYYVNRYGVINFLHTAKVIGVIYALITLVAYVAILLNPWLIHVGQYPFVHGGQGIFAFAGFDAREALVLLPHLNGFTLGPAPHAYFLLPIGNIVLYNYLINRRTRELVWLAIVSLAIFFSFSRSGMIAYLGSLVTGYIVFKSRSLDKLIVFSLVLLAGFYFLSDLVLSFYFEFSELKGVVGATDQASDLNKAFSGRISYWLYALDLFEKNPILGIGIVNFVEYTKHVLEGTKDAHNTYLQILVEVGLIFFVVYMVYIITIMFKILIETFAVKHDIILSGAYAFVFASMFGFLVFNFGSMMLYSYVFYVFIGVGWGVCDQRIARRYT